MAVVDTDERAPQLRSALFYHLSFSILVWCHVHLTKCEKIKQMKTAPLQKSGWLSPFVPCQLINHSTAPTPETPFNRPEKKATLSAHQATKATSAPLNIPWLLLTSHRYCEVFHIHLGLILGVISVQCVTIKSRLKAAINPLGLSLMIPTWEHFTASLS